MLIWILLFLLVVAISLILAVRSMSDFKESSLNLPAKYAVYLIRKPDALNQSTLNQFYQVTREKGLIVSIERLYKGNKKALVIFAPEEIVVSYKEQLDLLELEDYSQAQSQNPNQSLTAWEVGKKNPQSSIGNHSLKLPDLTADQQFWWQIVLQPVSLHPVSLVVNQLKNNSSPSNLSIKFAASFRGILLTEDSQTGVKMRDKMIADYKNNNLVMLPQQLTSSQITSYFRERAIGTTFLSQLVGQSLSQSKENDIVFVGSDEVMNLLTAVG